jgi:hypothetical protein
MPIIEANRLAAAAELDLDTLADRLAAEISARDAQVMYPPLVAAISHAR